MRVVRSVALSFALTAAGVGLATPASALATRTWVSGVGSDANSCSRTAPCQSFAFAISQTAVGGEVNCLDPGDFGAVIISNAITLKCDHQSNGGVLAVVVNAGPADAVVLSGLDFEGINNNGYGVRFVAGGSLVVVDCKFRNFVNYGIYFQPGGDAALHVLDTTINNSSSAGIFIAPNGAATANVTVTRTQTTGGTNGILANGNSTTGAINGVIRDSDISGNAQDGIIALQGTASHVTLSLDNVFVSGNGNTGLSAAGPRAGFLVSNSTVFGNGQGLFAGSGAVLASYGNNRVNGNHGADGAFSVSVPAK